jgi:ribosomal protein S18 acetylase RimI-like enzyme
MLTLRRARTDELDTLVAIDGDASALFDEAGLSTLLDDDHPFVRDERERWRNATRAGQVTLALVASGEAVGFSVLGTVDGQPYLDQLAVRVAAMGRGIGRTLLEHALRESSTAGELWLTTYAHLRFNRPFYERAGFRVVPESACGRQMRAVLQSQRRALPCPEQRIAMVRHCLR